MSETKPGAAVELPPCPFCGMQPRLDPPKSNGCIWMIVCPETSPCRGSWLGTCFPAEHREVAIATWNRRAPSADSQLLDALENAKVGFDANRTLDGTWIIKRVSKWIVKPSLREALRALVEKVK